MNYPENLILLLLKEIIKWYIKFNLIMYYNKYWFKLDVRKKPKHSICKSFNSPKAKKSEKYRFHWKEINQITWVPKNYFKLPIATAGDFKQT